MYQCQTHSKLQYISLYLGNVLFKDSNMIETNAERQHIPRCLGNVLYEDSEMFEHFCDCKWKAENKLSLYNEIYHLVKDDPLTGHVTPPPLLILSWCPSFKILVIFIFKVDIWLGISNCNGIPNYFFLILFSKLTFPLFIYTVYI